MKELRFFEVEFLRCQCELSYVTNRGRSCDLHFRIVRTHQAQYVLFFFFFFKVSSFSNPNSRNKTKNARIIPTIYHLGASR